MANIKRIYHGSSVIIKAPKLGLGRKNNDYGRGFYCTESMDLAKEWACTLLGGGFCNCYDLDMTMLNVLDLNSDEYSILNWMAVLAEHRLFSTGTPVAGRARKYLIDNFSVNVNTYDVIKGWRADDAYYDFADAFLNNAITVEQLSGAMTLGDLGEQIVLKSQLAFDSLSYIESIRAMVEEDHDGVQILRVFNLKKSNQVIEKMFLCQTDMQLILGYTDGFDYGTLEEIPLTELKEGFFKELTFITAQYPPNLVTYRFFTSETDMPDKYYYCADLEINGVGTVFTVIDISPYS
jgi:hypothetical protein